MLDAIMLNVVAPFTQSSKLTVIVARKYKTKIEEFFMANQPPFSPNFTFMVPKSFITAATGCTSLARYLAR
jgi:hypothetical protein